MLEITFAKWQLPDRTFLSAEPTIRTVAGPPGVTVIVQMAWRHECPEGRSFYFQGFARMRRILSTGETGMRFMHFTAVPCRRSPRMHIRVDWSSGRTGQDDEYDGEWHGPCCVDALAGQPDDHHHHANVSASSSHAARACEDDDDDDDDDDASHDDDGGAAAGAAAAAAAGGDAAGGSCCP